MTVYKSETVSSTVNRHTTLIFLEQGTAIFWTIVFIIVRSTTFMLSIM